jgi:hypothetical protein
MRAFSLLESIATGAPKNTSVATKDGRALTRNGKDVTTKKTFGKVAYLVLHAWETLSLAPALLNVVDIVDLAAEVGIWNDIRDSVAHDGAWLPAPHPARLKAQQRQIEVAAQARATDVTEGFAAYVKDMCVALDGVLWGLVDGKIQEFLVR